MRLLLANVVLAESVRLFQLHDADPDEYNISRTLSEAASRRMPGYSVEITDLGLRLEEALEMGLQTERFRCENSRMRDRRPSDEIAASDRQPKQLFDKLQLREWVTFAHPPGSPLPNHVDRLDSL